MSVLKGLRQSFLWSATAICVAGGWQAQIVRPQKKISGKPVTRAQRNSTTEQAVEAFKRGEVDAARSLFEKSLRTNPNDWEAHNFLGILDDAAGDLKNAEVHFQKAAKINSKSASARNNYGAILLKLNRSQEAAAEFENSLRIDPNQPNALINLAQIRFAEDTPAALKISFDLFRRASGLFKDATIERSLVVIALRLKETTEAARHYQNYLSLLSEMPAQSAASRVELGGALFDAKLFGEAETELKAALVADSENSEATALLAKIYLARNDVKSAGVLLETAVARKRATATIYSLLANVYEKVGRYENAIPTMRLAVNLQPDSENLRFQYGLLLTNADAPAAALIRLDEALKVFPNSSRLWLARGIANLKDNRNVEAVEAINKALALDSKFAPAYAYLGLAKMQIGDYDEAVKAYEKALINDSGLAVVHQLIADALLQQTDGDAARIESELKTSLKLAPDFTPAYLTLGKLYVRLQHWTEAATALNEVVRRDPESAEAFYQLGRVYARLKQKTDADAALAKFKMLSESQKAKSESDLRDVVRRLADVRF